MPDLKLKRAAAGIAEGRLMLQTCLDRIKDEFDQGSDRWKVGPEGEIVRERLGLLRDVIQRAKDIEEELSQIIEE